MYKQLLVITILMLTVVSGPSVVSAQQNTQDGTYNQAPANNNSGQTGGTTGSTDDQGGVDWRWLLPLLAIPMLYFMLRRRRDEERYNDRDERLNQRERFVGAKGGKSKKRDPDRDQDTEEKAI